MTNANVVNEKALLDEKSARNAEIETDVSVSDAPPPAKVIPAVRIKTDFRALARSFNAIDSRDYRANELGDSEFFAATYSHVLRFNATSGRWLYWTGHSWREDKHGVEIPAFAKYATELRIWQMQAALKSELARSSGDEEIDKLQRKLLDLELKSAYRSQTSRRIKSIIELSQSHVNLKSTQSQWDANPDLLATPNGVIDLATGEFREGKQSDMLSHAIPVRYDTGAKCPRWRQFLGEVLEGPEEVREMQKFLGYCLTGHTTEQVVAFWQGNGSNGKSKLITAVTEIMGWDENGYSWRMDMACLDESSKNNIPNDLAALVGKRLAIAAEARPNTSIDVAKVKMLSGEDVVPGRRLYAEHFNFRPSAKIVLNVNHLPAANDTSNGYWRRALCWRFLRDFEIAGSGKDKNLSDKLREEYSGILNWLLEGVTVWRREGLTPTPKMIEMTCQYREANNPIGNFVDDCLVFEDDRIATIANLRTRMKEWQAEEDEQLKWGQVRDYLLRKGCTEGRKGEARHLKGVRVKESVTPAVIDPLA